jgi:hypothetical protein
MCPAMFQDAQKNLVSRTRDAVMDVSVSSPTSLLSDILPRAWAIWVVYWNVYSPWNGLFYGWIQVSFECEVGANKSQCMSSVWNIWLDVCVNALYVQLKCDVARAHTHTYTHEYRSAPVCALYTQLTSALWSTYITCFKKACFISFSRISLIPFPYQGIAS